MDFIEQLFGVSPDNGDGTTEILWLAVLAILLGLALFWRRGRIFRPFGVPARPAGLARFTCIDRTPVGDEEAVLVTGNVAAADVKSLIGATVQIDGVDHVVHDAVAADRPAKSGQPVMMRVRRLVP